MDSTSTNKLPNGHYYIRNHEEFAGRHQHEDNSLQPKGVFCPTNDVDTFHIEKLPNGRYRIKARGAPTGVIHKNVYAILTHAQPAEEWNITRVWNGQYIIENKSKTAGWIRPNNHHEPIEVKPLTPTKSIPPHYPPPQTWIIQPHV